MKLEEYKHPEFTSLATSQLMTKTAGIFDSADFLECYDRVLPLSDHYNLITQTHLRVLSGRNRILDLGCGTGIPTIGFLKAGSHVCAVDKSEQSLNLLSRKASRFDSAGRIKVVRKDLDEDCDLSQFGAFNGINSSIMAHLLEDYHSHIRNSFDMLTHGGVFVITARQSRSDDIIATILTNSLRRLGMLEQLKKEADMVIEYLLNTASQRTMSFMDSNETIELMSNIGFKNILIHPNMTQGVMFTISGEKG